MGRKFIQYIEEDKVHGCKKCKIVPLVGLS